MDWRHGTARRMFLVCSVDVCHRRIARANPAVTIDLWTLRNSQPTASKQDWGFRQKPNHHLRRALRRSYRSIHPTAGCFLLPKQQPFKFLVSGIPAKTSGASFLPNLPSPSKPSVEPSSVLPARGPPLAHVTGPRPCRLLAACPCPCATRQASRQASKQASRQAGRQARKQLPAPNQSKTASPCPLRCPSVQA
jgi:hypothetical protein